MSFDFERKRTPKEIMKTLSEVIAQHEYCLTLGFHACGDCKYRDTDGVCRMREDALHYLKEYKTLQYGYIKAMADLEDNPPLTMKEFSRMIDTEPIWCQELQEWYLFLAYDDGDNRIQLMTDKGDIETFDEDDLEKYPLYRRK